MFQRSICWRTMTLICQRANLALDWTQARAVCLAEAERILGRSAAAEDAAQEAVIRAWRRHDACRTPERPAPWLTTIARREAWRQIARRPHEEELTAQTLACRDQGGTAPDLHEAIQRLGADDRALIVGRYWLDLPDDVLARRFGIAEATVRVRLHRVRARLRQTLLET
jgi:RNA polymerase sigma-70 factor (ECF subfamily)